MNKNEVILCGVRPTGEIHLGNYFGAMLPLKNIALTHKDALILVFVADYHAMTSKQKSQSFKESRHHIAAAWLSMDIPNVNVFFQSDVPELLEVYWILSTRSSLAMLKRCHAFKSTEDKESMSLSLFSYPVLMASDILSYESSFVTIGPDQLQHLEVAVYLAKKFGLKVPQAIIGSNVSVPGLDGRKMSKSYGNTIPLFIKPKDLYKIIMNIPTNSQSASETKDWSSCKLFQIYQLIAEEAKTIEMRERYVSGIGWKEVKEQMYLTFLDRFTSINERYERIIEDSASILLQARNGSHLARDKAVKVLTKLKLDLGIL